MKKFSSINESDSFNGNLDQLKQKIQHFKEIYEVLSDFDDAEMIDGFNAINQILNWSEADIREEYNSLSTNHTNTGADLIKIKIIQKFLI